MHITDVVGAIFKQTTTFKPAQPLILNTRNSSASNTDVGGFMILIICGTILFTWVYNNTGGSILAAMPFHTMNNLSFFIFPILETALGSLYPLILNAASIVTMLMLLGPKTLLILWQKFMQAKQKNKESSSRGFLALLFC